MIQDTLQDVFRRVFNDPSVELRDDMTADEVEAWDSLTHIQLIVETEKTFHVKFKNSEIAKLRCVGDLKALVARHRTDLTVATT